MLILTEENYQAQKVFAKPNDLSSYLVSKHDYSKRDIISRQMNILTSQYSGYIYTLVVADKIYKIQKAVFTKG